MKTNNWVLSTGAILLLAVLLTGCPQTVDPVSVSERMAMYKTDVEAKAWGNLKGHTHPDALMYNLNNTSIWTTIYPLSGAFSYSISGDTATGTKDGITCTYYLKEDDKDVYKIYQIVNTTADPDVTIFQ